MAAKWFRDCGHSAFISYAFDDDQGWNWWVTNFSKELDMSLPTQLRGIYPVPATHLSRKNGAISGVLNDQLRERIAQSFAMILVVHSNYAKSKWCLKELAHFKSLFGNEGFRDRLYIIALSKTSIEEVKGTDEWKQLCSGEDLIHLPFYQEEFTNWPIDIYSDSSPGVVMNAFWKPFLRLREDFVKKIKANVELQLRGLPPAAAARASALAAAPPPQSASVAATVRIYIESNHNEVDHWESVGEQAVKSWEAVVKDNPPPQIYVRPSGLPMDDIDQYPRLDDADGVILLWGKKNSDSLLAQINKVEGKLSWPDSPPGVVAYLIPPKGDSDEPIAAVGWPVVRFNAPKGQPIEVVRQDAHRLEAFLSKVLARKTKRAKAAREAQLAPQP